MDSRDLVKKTLISNGYKIVTVTSKDYPGMVSILKLRVGERCISDNIIEERDDFGLSEIEKERLMT